MVQVDSDNSPAPATTPPSAPWANVLEQILRCPSCGESVEVDPDLKCGSCGWSGATTRGVVDFVDESRLDSSHHEELSAQREAVDAYYENEGKVCCHWDRISANELPDRLNHPSGYVLDLGCGTGSAGGALRRGGAKVIGVDLSVDCLLQAQRRMDAVVRADAVRLPFADNTFDALVSRGALHHLADPLTALAEAARVLKPGAKAVFADPREFVWLEPIKDALRKTDDSFSDDHHAFEMDEYRSLIAAHFKILKTESEHPLGVLLAAGLDVLPLPVPLPARLLAEGLYSMDRLLNETPFKKAGHLLVVTAEKR